MGWLLLRVCLLSFSKLYVTFLSLVYRLYEYSEKTGLRI